MSREKEIKETVSERYAQIARQVAERAAASCCSPQPSCCAPAESAVVNPVTGEVYALEDLKELPIEAVEASLGCGNPVAMAELRPGEMVLDLGSGGGIDVLLSARRVGPTGKAYGLDMLDEMLELARQNQRKAGIENAEFLKGEMENIPLPDESVDVVISNCVVNLSPEKERVLGEAYRVLKPGGRLAISDIIVRGDMSDEMRRNLTLWSACIAGALKKEEYVDKLKAAGFRNIGVDITRLWAQADLQAITGTSSYCGAPAEGTASPAFLSAFIRAQKPACGESKCSG
ncbi:MAG: arsenite methyltransferase [Dehalococcoidia bacterium]